MKNVKSLPKDLRPREKLIKYGAAVLSLEELIAALLVTGNKITSVSILSGRVAKVLENTAEIDKNLLLSLGLGVAKTTQILACLEIGRRYLEKEKVVNAISASQIFALSQEIIDKDKESLLCFYINGRGEILKREIVAVGSMNSALVLPREIFSLIKELPVASIILVHNHPSGELNASQTDIKFTRRVKIAGEILGVKLLDHLIITSKGWKQIKV